MQVCAESRFAEYADDCACQGVQSVTEFKQTERYCMTTARNDRATLAVSVTIQRHKHVVLWVPATSDIILVTIAPMTPCKHRTVD